MSVKKFFMAVIILITFSACAKARNIIPISTLEFGMTREQVNSLIGAEPDTSGDGYDTYLYIPTDLDARLNSTIFNYNGGARLYAFYTESDYSEFSEAEALLTDITEKLDSLYSFSEDGWTSDRDEEKNCVTFANINMKIAVRVQINSYDEGFNVSVTVMSDEHNEDENAENFPVIPKK